MVGQIVIPTGLPATVAMIVSFEKNAGILAELFEIKRIEMGHDVLMKSTLITFQTKHPISLFINDFFGNLGLTTHRVYTHYTAFNLQ